MLKKTSYEKIFKIMDNDAFIILFFALLSLVSALIMVRSHSVIASWDINFHWSRVYDMHASLLHGSLFNDVALNYFNQSGSAAMTIYPKINLLPVVVLSFFIKSYIRLIYITFILRNFFALIVAYYSCLKFTKSKAISYTFSISYTLSTVTLFYSFRSMDMGVSSSLIYLPLIIFGSYELIQNNHWQELTIGICAVIFCHVITSVMSVMLVFIIFLINFNKIKDANHIKTLLKSVVTIALATSIFWIPFLVLVSKNKIAMPNVRTLLLGVDYHSLISTIFNNGIAQYLTIFAFAGFILSLVNYKKLNMYSKQLFWISISFLIVSSEFFPWNMLNNTFLQSTFQFPYRFLLITQAILCYLFSEQIVIIAKNKKKKVLAIVIISLSVLCTQITGQKEVLGMDKAYDFTHFLNSGLLYNDYWNSDFNDAPNFLYGIVSSHEGTYGEDKHVSMKLLGNGKYSFSLNKNVNNFKIPFVTYSGIIYHVKLDSKKVDFYSDHNNQLTVNHVNEGKHKLQVIVNKSWYDYLSYVLSLFGIFILLFSWIKLLAIKRKLK